MKESHEDICTEKEGLRVCACPDCGVKIVLPQLASGVACIICRNCGYRSCS